MFHVGSHEVHLKNNISDNLLEEEEEKVEEEKEKINMPTILVGICAMNKKTSSMPMKEILSRLKRFKFLDFILFSDDTIQNSPIEDWPIVDCLVSFYSNGFPLQKAVKYAELRKPLILNDLKMQEYLLDRRKVYRTLEANDIELPRYAIFNRNENNEPENGCEEIEEVDDIIIVNGVTFKKPFVEKPISAEDHRICIYYQSSAGGGCQNLFRKIGDRSSEYSSNGLIRRQGSYIYEDFMPTDGTDVKVYTVGAEYAHAEARKSPALDGKVERDSRGKEVRYPVILSAYEKLIAQKVTKVFKQTVCGFDFLRTNGKSLVCDVNGFSFVKTSKKYYDDCSQLLADIILQNLAPQRWQPTLRKSPGEPFFEQFQFPPSASRGIELRSVVAIMRHGDRTPKQKMKIVVSHRLFFEMFYKYGGDEEGRLKLKKPKHLQEILEIVRKLIDGYDEESLQPITEVKSKLIQMRTVLEMYGRFDGINRKVQMKAMNDKRNVGMFAKLRGRNEMEEGTVEANLLVIVKWGGELTPMGKYQAENLGRAFRCVYPGGEGTYGRIPGCGLLRLHSTYRHDLKIYASDEGRVQMTAAAFAKGLLALEGELTPVLVSLVNSDKYVTNMLDSPNDVSGTLIRVKSRLHNHLHSTTDFIEEDFQKLATTENSAVAKAMEIVRNPQEMCEKVYELVEHLTDQITKMCENGRMDEGSIPLYYEENLNLMKLRWEKLKKDFKNENEFDISLIPDIYDCVKYDYQHNRSLELQWIPELYHLTKALADIVIPQEYGISSEEKLKISKQLCSSFFKKIQADLQYNVNQLNESVNRLDPRESIGVEDPHQHVRTRLYFTSESHVHSVINALKHGVLSQGLVDYEWKKAIDLLNNTAELNYLTQIVFMQYEDLTVSPSSKDRFRIEIFFSPGLKTPNSPEIAMQLQDESLCNRLDYALPKIYQNEKQKEREEKREAEVRKRAKRLIKLRRASSFDNAYSLYNNFEMNGRVRNDTDPTSRKFSHAKPIKLVRQSTLETIFPTSSSLIMDETVNIRGAEIIETLPSLHPLVSLHSAINQAKMDEFLNDMKTMDWKSSVNPIYENVEKTNETNVNIMRNGEVLLM
ncbi:inositol hexakisphosphate and diphosphoinositol-pentakisphosphate kinase 2-like isoform X2 [Hydractinia symbiolongicarpus]|uniref:inositol hexakisphosphate and diphosphoinositol-pentakisphosphate kinase 2-like isoform X2 n=1 Tax=Hydractinia symbiolongicarpus TaxID=13093 RepID=UPI00254FA640|nr:inositol hexakisphosphate and diphosphoinositol-pentakisphosphate kinase 2-like isoform X2 [Hydractinia symbiolongicarpus]